MVAYATSSLCYPSVKLRMHSCSSDQDKQDKRNYQRTDTRFIDPGTNSFLRLRYY